jgi:hypothetical protein
MAQIATGNTEDALDKKWNGSLYFSGYYRIESRTGIAGMQFASGGIVGYAEGVKARKKMRTTR